MKILLATDFEKESQNAIDYAVNLFSSDLFKDVTFYLSHASSSTDKKSIEDQLEDESKRLARPGQNLETIVLQGPIAPSINDFVKDNEVDLIVMGSREKEVDHQLVIGSNAMEISARAECSVLVVPNDMAPNKKPGTIAFGTDYNAMNIPREALVILKSLLKAYDSTLKVFHVYPSGDLSALKAELESKINHYFLERVNHEFHPVIHEKPYEGIITFIKNEKPDILTVIPRERHFVDEIHRPSVTKQMAYEVKIPLLVLR